MSRFNMITFLLVVSLVAVEHGIAATFPHPRPQPYRQTAMVPMPMPAATTPQATPDLLRVPESFVPREFFRRPSGRMPLPPATRRRAPEPNEAASQASNMRDSIPGVTDRNLGLRTAVSEVHRQQLLPSREYVFDFLTTNLGVTMGNGGVQVNANSETFPAVIGHGVAMTVGFLAPCGINLPHTHPRATEFNLVVKGSLTAGLFQENESRFITNIVKTGQATIFPQGAIHFEQNIGCDPAIFIAGFNHEDPGVSTVANNFFFGLPADVVGASLGGLNITTIEDLARFIPTNPAFGSEECLRRCGIHRAPILLPPMSPASSD